MAQQTAIIVTMTTRIPAMMPPTSAAGLALLADGAGVGVILSIKRIESDHKPARLRDLKVVRQTIRII